MKILFLLCTLIVAVTCDQWSSKMKGNCFIFVRRADDPTKSVGTAICCHNAWKNKQTQYPRFHPNNPVEVNIAALNDVANYKNFIGRKRCRSYHGKYEYVP